MTSRTSQWHFVMPRVGHISHMVTPAKVEGLRAPVHSRIRTTTTSATKISRSTQFIIVPRFSEALGSNPGKFSGIAPTGTSCHHVGTIIYRLNPGGNVWMAKRSVKRAAVNSYSTFIRWNLSQSTTTTTTMPRVGVEHAFILYRMYRCGGMV